jgi:hypothetical protein
MIKVHCSPSLSRMFPLKLGAIHYYIKTNKVVIYFDTKQYNFVKCEIIGIKFTNDRPFFMHIIITRTQYCVLSLSFVHNCHSLSISGSRYETDISVYVMYNY